jgi:hypothetical protein
LINDQLGLNPFDRPAIIQEKRKYANFTVTDIGGPVEIIAWRARQKEIEAMNQTIRMQNLDHQKNTMFGIDAPQGDGVTWEGSAVTQGWKSDTTWRDKLNFVKSEKKRLATLELRDLNSDPLFTLTPEAPSKKTLLQTIKGWIKNLWESAQEK